MKSLFALFGLVGVLFLGGCTCSGAKVLSAQHHIRSLWEIDREATLDLVRERYPDEAGDLTLRNIDQVPGVYNMILELNPYDRFVLSLRINGELYEVNGGYRVYRGESGNLVRLFAPTAENEDLPELNTYIRAMVIDIDQSGRRAIVRSLDEIDTVLKAMD